MSKKILKRSFALGALMAFVITGNAWAAVAMDLKTNESRGAIELFESGALDCDLNDYKLTINAPASNGIWVNGWTYDIYGSENSMLEINSAGVGLGAYGEVDVGALNISANGYALQSYAGSTIVKADVINLSSYSSGINVIGDYAEQILNVDIDFDESLTIQGINGASGIESYNNSGTVSVNGTDGSVLNIKTDGTAVLAGYKTKVYINTKLDANNQLVYDGGSTTVIKGGIEAQEFAVVNLALKGNDSSLSGAIKTGENATTNLILEGGTWNVTDDSVVSGIVVNGDAAIAGVDDSSVTLNKKITEKEKYAIVHNGGKLTIENIVLENIEKEYNKKQENDNGIVYGSVLYSDTGNGVIEIKNSIIRNNTNIGDCKNYAVVHVTTDMDITNSDFINNSSSYMGGALKLHQNKANEIEYKITDTDFNGNRANSGGAIQANSGAVINFWGTNNFVGNEVTKDNGDCGGAICTEGAKITFYGNTTFDGNKAINGNGGAIAQHYNGATMVFAEGSTTNFKNNVAKDKGGAIYNIAHSGGTDAIIQIYGDVNFEGNTAGEGKDIYNERTLQILGGTTRVDGGIVSKGANAFVEISNGATLALAGGNTSINKLQGEIGVIRFENSDANLIVEENTNAGLKFTATSEVNKAVGGDANKLISKVDWYEDTTMVLEASDIVGEVTAELGKGEDGNLVVKSKTEAVNPVNQSIGEAGISLKLHWRSHMNDMNKRMGELRNANGEHGVWTRMVRGESEYEGVKAQYNQYQLGYDEKLSVDKRWTVGAAVTFAEGDASYGNGTTEDKSTAFAIYGSKLNDDGTFVDLIARYARIESDLEDATSGKGDYSTNGMSVSAEFGKRIQQGNGLWIEPQVELTYGTVDDAEFQLGGKTVHVGDMDSIIGRVGFSLGKDIKQGNVYARASYLYDFDGETENAFSNATDSRTIADDLGGGWWEVGVGANINLSKATYIYADVEKTFGGEVDTNWQWNLGVRYSF